MPKLTTAEIAAKADYFHTSGPNAVSGENGQTARALTAAYNALADTEVEAKAVIACLLAQKGCEYFDPAGDGTLTDLCDIIMFS